MAASIILYGVKATVRNRTWECPVKALRKMLDATLPESGGSDPDPDGNAAKAAVAFFNRHSRKAKPQLLTLDPVPYVKGRVY